MSPSSADAEESKANAKAAQDVKDVLAELKTEKPEAEASTASEPVIEDNAPEVDRDEKTKLPSGAKELVNFEEKTEKTEQPRDEKDVNEDVKTGEVKSTEKDAEKSIERGHSANYRGRGRGRGGARSVEDRKKFKENMKSDFTAQEETDDPVQIRKQVRLISSIFPTA